ncbi:hypothetical protein [Streptomyces sp. NBC_01618]|uniref:hypothetical protein n=1 Tax=Streptomyces sp. NBC_01618 TaxID=2975900 RepID=UPI00386ABE13|nr:hypothetical protein OH735_28130 [Streptomyces sp. NBC_01618]
MNPAQIVKNTGEYNAWHKSPVTDTVQKWLSGTAVNHGFVLQARGRHRRPPLRGR